MRLDSAGIEDIMNVVVTYFPPAPEPASAPRPPDVRSDRRLVLQLVSRCERDDSWLARAGHAAASHLLHGTVHAPAHDTHAE